MKTDRFISMSNHRRVAGASLVGVAAAVAISPLAQPASAAPSASGQTAGLDSEAAASPQVAAPEVTPNYGFQKVRVGVQIASGAYVPAGATTAGSKITITETGPNAASSPGTTTCTTDPSTVVAGSSATYCVFDNGGASSDPNYSTFPGDSVTVTQTGANPGLVSATQPATEGPCAAADGDIICGADGYAVVTDSGIAPTAANDRSAVIDGKSVSLNVLANDTTAGAVPTLKIVSPTAHGAVRVVASGAALRIRYTPKKGFSGSDHFAYQLRTANGSATAIATIVVVAGAPKAKNDKATTKAGHAVKIHVLTNDQGYGGGSLKVARPVTPSMDR